MHVYCMGRLARCLALCRSVSLSLQRNALCLSLCDEIMLQLYATVPQTLGVLARASSPSKHVDAFSHTFELRAAGDTRIPRSITALRHIPGRHRKANTASCSLADWHAHCCSEHAGKCWLSPTHEASWRDMTSCRCYTAEGRGKKSNEEEWPKHLREGVCGRLCPSRGITGGASRVKKCLFGNGRRTPAILAPTAVWASATKA
jgi:hypothetical protein